MDRSGKMRVWSCAERRLLQELNDPNIPIYPIGFRPDSRWLLSVDGKGKAIWWDALTWQPARTFVLEMKSHATEAVSPDGRLLVVGTETGAVHWLNAETGEVLATRSDAHRFPVIGIAFSADGAQAASVGWDGRLAIWNPSSRELMTSFKGHMLGAHAVAFSPDGRRLATSSVGREAVRLWDLSTHRELITLAGQGSNFRYVAFSPDGRWVTACSEEGKLHLWRAPSWAEIEAAEKKPESSQSP